MEKRSSTHDLVLDMVSAADKVFKDECGDYPLYTLWDEKDYFNTCMDVVEEIILNDFPKFLGYFRFLRDTKYNKYFGDHFGGKKSE